MNALDGPVANGNLQDPFLQDASSLPDGKIGLVNRRLGSTKHRFNRLCAVDW